MKKLMLFSLFLIVVFLPACKDEFGEEVFFEGVKKVCFKVLKDSGDAICITDTRICRRRAARFYRKGILLFTKHGHRSIYKLSGEKKKLVDYCSLSLYSEAKEDLGGW